MAMEQQQQIKVPADKATFLLELSKLSVESLRILAEKSKKPGIEKKLQTYQSLL